MMTTTDLTPLWWLSWNQHADPKHGLDARPVAWPPPVPVLAFWRTGEAFDGSYCTVVALVRAATATEAQDVITSAWSPGIGAWRFCNVYAAEDAPGDRFPAPEWSFGLGRWPWSTACGTAQGGEGGAS